MTDPMNQSPSAETVRAKVIVAKVFEQYDSGEQIGRDIVEKLLVNAIAHALSEREAEIARLTADRSAFAQETQTYRDAWLGDQKKLAAQAARIRELEAVLEQVLHEGVTAGKLKDAVEEALASAPGEGDNMMNEKELPGKRKREAE